MSKITESEISHRCHSGRSGIYKIYNKYNHKVYIGQSVNIYKRYSRHKRSVNKTKTNPTRLVNAFKKYGFDNFTFSVLEFCDKSGAIC